VTFFTELEYKRYKITKKKKYPEKERIKLETSQYLILRQVQSCNNPKQYTGIKANS
jgi:hypothetical protein